MIVFLYGADTFRSRQKLRELKAKFMREVDPGGSGIVSLSGESLDPAAFNEAVSSASLFARKRMVVIERLFSNKSKNVLVRVEEFLLKSSGLKAGDANSNIVIFWEDAASSKAGAGLWRKLANEKFAQNFKELSNTEAAGWIREESLKRGGKIRQAAAAQMVSLLGNDLWILSGELDKLLHYKQAQDKRLIDAGSEAIIESADVDELVKGQLSENIFALTDAIGNKNKAQAFRLFERELEAGVSESNLLFMILRQFRILLQVRQGLDSGQTPRKLMSMLGLHPFIVQKSLNQVRNFTLPALKGVFYQLVRIDKDIKTGKADAKTSLSTLLARL